MLDPDHRFEQERQDLFPVDAAQGQGDLGLDDAELHSQVKAGAASFQGKIPLFSRERVQGRRELDLAQLANVLADELIEQVEDERREHVHAEKAQIVARAQTRHVQPQLGQGRVGFLDDLVDGVDIGMLGQPPAGQRAILVNQMFAGGLHGRDGAVFGGGQLDQLPGAPPGLRGKIKMVSQQQQKRLPPCERSRAPDRVTVALGLGLDGELQPLLEFDNAACLFLGPVEPLVGRAQVGGVVAKVGAINGFVTRCADDADFLDAAFKGFLGDDLEDGLGQSVAIDQRAAWPSARCPTPDIAGPRDRPP